MNDDNAGLRADLMQAITVSGRKLRTLFDSRVRAHGLTLPRARALFYLSERGCMKQSDLAEVLEIEGPTLVRMLDGLEKQGLIDRHVSPEDRRVREITLTERGAASAAEMGGIAAAIREELLEGVDARSLEQVIDVLRQIIRTGSAALGEATPEK